MTTAYKGKRPRAKTSFCWHCGRQLRAGGYAYDIVTDESGHEHPVHKACAANPDEVVAEDEP